MSAFLAFAFCCACAMVLFHGDADAVDATTNASAARIASFFTGGPPVQASETTDGKRLFRFAGRARRQFRGPFLLTFRVLARGLDERAEDRRRRRLAAHVLGVPLHAEVERMARVLEAFDDAVGRVRGDAQAVADVLDGLVMRRVHLELALAKDLRETRAAVDGDVVAMAVRRLAGVIDVALDVLDERAARGDVHDLHAEADAERGDAAVARDAGEGEVVVLPPRIHRLDARLRRLAARGGGRVAGRGGAAGRRPRGGGARGGRRRPRPRSPAAAGGGRESRRRAAAS